MNSLKKSVRLAKILVVALSFLILCFSTPALADTINLTDAAAKDLLESIQITKGKFSVDVKAKVPGQITVRRAVVSLPSGETGKINKIVITGPNGKREFGCQGIQVKDGTDLIKACGGPAVLEAGKTSYIAEGSDFGPNPDAKLKVDLD